MMLATIFMSSLYESIFQEELTGHVFHFRNFCTTIDSTITIKIKQFLVCMPSILGISELQ